MTRSKINRRALGVLIAVAAVFITFIVLVFVNQKRSAAASSAETASYKTYNITVAADRGEILDRNGNTFVYNEQVNSIVLNALTFPTEKAQGNEIILGLIRYLESKDEDWIDTLPLYRDEHGRMQFKEDREADIRWMKSAYYLNLNSYATPQNCYDALVEEYGLQPFARRTR